LHEWHAAGEKNAGDAIPTTGELCSLTIHHRADPLLSLQWPSPWGGD
jgi:hypothetical protein